MCISHIPMQTLQRCYHWPIILGETSPPIGKLMWLRRARIATATILATSPIIIATGGAIYSPALWRVALKESFCFSVPNTVACFCSSTTKHGEKATVAASEPAWVRWGCGTQAGAQHSG